MRHLNGDALVLDGAFDLIAVAGVALEPLPFGPPPWHRRIAMAPRIPAGAPDRAAASAGANRHAPPAIALPVALPNQAAARCEAIRPCWRSESHANAHQPDSRQALPKLPRA